MADSWLTRQTFRQSGYTLLETLLAVAIAALIVLLIFSLYFAVTNTLQGQDERRNGRDASVRAIEQLSEDLTCAYIARDGAGCAFTLDPLQKAGSLLSFCTAKREPGVADLMWFSVERIDYLMDQDQSRLLRVSKPTTGPGSRLSAQTNAVAADVQAFEVLVYDGREWIAEWPADESAALPQAVRLKLISGSESAKTFETDIIIPAGQVVSSEVVRAVAR